MDGRPIRESSRSTKREEAKRLHREREGRVATGQTISRPVDEVRYEEVAADLRAYYQVYGARDLKEAEYRLKRLDTYFSGRRVASIGPADLTAYAARRQAEGIKNATINRELATLSRMLHLAHENDKLLKVPRIRKLREAAPRQGFFEREQFEAVRRQLSPDLQVVATIGYVYGWRVRGEVLTLQRRQVDLAAGTLRLKPGTTKNGDGRVVYLTSKLKSLLAAQLERVRALERELGRYPYTPSHTCHQGTGKASIKDFHKAWQAACRKASCPELLKHDLRRTAVRNMVNLGVPERVAMKITGHRTRSVFDRYHIVAPVDLQNAARRLSDSAGTI